MAEVYRVRDEEKGRVRALKILRHKALRRRETIERFRLEYEVVKKLDHPNVVRAFDFGRHESRGAQLPWFTMDYYPYNLRQRLPQVSIGEGIRILLPVLSALDYAHEKRIFHRDLKPMNVLVNAEGHAVLTDFGIAKDQTQDLNLTGRSIIGTPKYISPEAIKGLEIGSASDLYSIGIILFHMCTKRFPFSGTDQEILRAHIMDTAPRVCEIIPVISEQLEECIAICLAKEPGDRYQSADQLRADLSRTPELSEATERILEPGELVSKNKYRVLGIIEKGGFGEVYRVKHVTTGKLFALKILLPELSYDQESVRRFETEIKVINAVDHPNVVEVVESGIMSITGARSPTSSCPTSPGRCRAP